MVAVNGRRIGVSSRPPRDPGAEAYTARLAVDVTPRLRGRITIVAFQRGLTVAEMLRALLEHEYGDSGGPGDD